MRRSNIKTIFTLLRCLVICCCFLNTIFNSPVSCFLWAQVRWGFHSCQCSLEDMLADSGLLSIWRVFLVFLQLVKKNKKQGEHTKRAVIERVCETVGMLTSSKNQRKQMRWERRSSVYRCFLVKPQWDSEKPASLPGTAGCPIPPEVSQFCFLIHPDTTDFSCCPCSKVQNKQTCQSNEMTMNSGFVFFTNFTNILKVDLVES